VRLPSLSTVWRPLGGGLGLALLAAGVYLQSRPREAAAPEPALHAESAAVSALQAWQRGEREDPDRFLDALGKDDAPAAPLLAGALASPLARETEAAALHALERIGGPSGVKALHEIGAMRPDLAADCVVRLSRIEGRDAAPALLEVLDAEREVGPFSAAAVRALGKTTLRSLVPRLSSLALAALDPRVREEAAAALGAIADPDGLPALIRLLEDREPRVRLQAIRAVGRIRTQDAASSLEAFLSAKPPALERVIAQEALARLRGEDPRGARARSD
jgi:HEAT repeat protein